ncbi:hypothetical protein LQ318_02410 [Aliifodinibius salicampi]|uniref:Sulfotransferase family protein n=1 Tax=Fodinibius salicampi TaxID=1920655 RepID=A0ABT3PV56_9BACT|nr:hypothetical protein [Fodinibius salicampi]MCW9711746.1 hypothetical protein [Fodinibius salicampi]
MSFIKSTKNLIAKTIVLYLIHGPIVYYVIGMRRSGNHAFINWLTNALEEQYASLKPKIDNLYITSTGKTVFLDEVNIKSGKRFLSVLWNNRELIKNCQYLIISAEDCGPNYNNFRIPKWNEAIYIKRSVLNVVASRLRYLQKKASEGIGYSEHNVDVSFFETLLEWHSIPENFKVWEYEKWIVSKEYRLNFLQQLELKVDIIPTMSSQGGGSSFSGQEKPSTVEALSRYEQVNFSPPIINLVTDVKYQKLLNQSEVDYLKKNP